MQHSAHDIFVANVLSLLEQQGITQAELARRMRCSRPYVSQIISQRTDPGLRVVDRLAQALGVEVECLFMTTARTKKFLALN